MSREFLEAFAEGLKSKFQINREISEGQLRDEISKLIETIGPSIKNVNVSLLGEESVSEHKTRLDYGVYVDNLLCGYVEVKKPGKGANPSKFTVIHDREQWKKLQNMPNLIYTDGTDWALYRNGERANGHDEIRINQDVFAKGKLSISDDVVNSMTRMLQDFFTWEPQVPTNPETLAEFIAPLSRILKEEVKDATKVKGSEFKILADDWRKSLFPDASDSQFADSYAQTVTYALLLARLSGAKNLEPNKAKELLDKNNGILAQTLGVLGQDNASVKSLAGFNLLRRTLEALNPESMNRDIHDLWLYFYETFLTKYDPKLRKNLGVFYTPREVVRLQVRLASELLETKFGKQLGFADAGVSFIDPAVGTGTYLLETVEYGLKKVEERLGSTLVPECAERMAGNMYGMEMLVGPYAVAHLRLRQIFEDKLHHNCGKSKKTDSSIYPLNIFLANTMASPNLIPDDVLNPSLFYKKLTEEHEKARQIKNEGNILVCIGNPPYNRHESDTSYGGWVVNGDEGGQKKPIFDAFTEPAKELGEGKYLRNIYNSYVYFWRWALWRLFEQQSCGGIVTFITPSSYIAGKSFVGMRKFMRETFDELWILDLEGENRQARISQNVFAIKTPVAIAIGYRGSTKKTDSPAIVHYAKINAPKREIKLQKLSEIKELNDIEWVDCPEGLTDPFLPLEERGMFTDWPKLDSLFPWMHPGSMFCRTWPIAETEEVLQKRWEFFCAADSNEKKKLFIESRDRKIDKQYNNIYGEKEPPLIDCETDSPIPKVMRYGFRFLDRMYALMDYRFGDTMRPQLVQVHSEKNIYFASMNESHFGEGPALVASVDVPDKHFFVGGGNKDIFPLFRDKDCQNANITNGVLETLSETYGLKVSATDFACYVYAILSGRSYVRRFWNELRRPGARVPITKNRNLFADSVKIGKKLLILHTYGEWSIEGGRSVLPQGKAKITKAIFDAQNYPDSVQYSVDTCEIQIGSGLIGPVDSRVWDYSVSNRKIIQTWVEHRIKGNKRKGRTESKLDEIVPEQWTADLSNELLKLIWIIESTVETEPELESLLDKIIDDSCFKIEDLPEPNINERSPPAKIKPPSDQFAFKY